MLLLQLIALIALLVLAVTAAVWARTQQARPVDVVSRIRGVSAQPTGALFVPQVDTSPLERVGAQLELLAPSLFGSTHQQERLVQAGFNSAAAPALYVAAQMCMAALGVLVMGTLLRGRELPILVTGMVLGGMIGFTIPTAAVSHLREQRQNRMRRGLPDVLDLLLVCVEAGISLDAAILRVGREIASIHPDLSDELLTLGRKQNAGVPREDALRGMWNRTGLSELRVLTANIIQSERWGTSIARVLRIDAEVLRRQRREAAEKRAALAGTKMIFPLGLLILPALLIVIGGPMLIQIRDVFNEISRAQ